MDRRRLVTADTIGVGGFRTLIGYATVQICEKHQKTLEYVGDVDGVHYFACPVEDADASL